MKRLPVIVALLVLVGPPAHGATALTVTAGRIVLSATGRLTADGGVQLGDGRVNLRGHTFVFDTRSGRGQLTSARAQVEDGVVEGRRIELEVRRSRVETLTASGAASFEIRRAVLYADRIDVVVSRRGLRATGDVRVFVPPDVVAFGQSLVYDAAHDGAVLEGPVRIQSGTGLLTGEVLRARAVSGNPEIVVSGRVEFDYGEGSGRARLARLWPGQHRAVLEDDVFLQHGRQRLWAGRVTVFYRDRRIAADDVRQIVLEEATASSGGRPGVKGSSGEGDG